MVVIVTVLLACKYCISPSGFPPLHVILDAGIVREIVFPVIPKNKLLLRTLLPKAIHTGKDIDVSAVQLLKLRSYNILIHAGNDIDVNDVQFLNSLPPVRNSTKGNDIDVNDVQFSKADVLIYLAIGNDIDVNDVQL